MATQKLNISDVMSEAKEISKSHLPLCLLFNLPLSFSIVAYPTLQHSLAAPHPKSPFQLPFNGDPIVFKPVGLFFIYLFTILCLSVCATGTVSYSVYHGFLGKPVEFVYAIKSLSNSLIRLFVTFISAHAIILVGLVVISFIVFGVNSGIGYPRFEIQYGFIHIPVFYVLGWVLFGLGLLYLYANWVLAPVIVVVESSWGIEPLRRSAYLVKGNRGAVVRLLVSICGMTWLTVFGFGTWGQIIPFGSSVHGSTLVVVMMAFGSSILSTHLLHSLIAITILYRKCKALRGELAEEINNREYITLPLDDEETVANVV